MTAIVKNFMNKTTYILILCMGYVCLPGLAVDLYGADPAPAAVSQKASTPAVKSEPVALAPESEAVPAPVAVAPAPQATGEDTISLDFKDAEIGSVLRVLSMKSNVNIVTGPEVAGLITVRLDNVPWEKALEVILRTYDYVYERDGNIIRVTTRDKMKLEPVETKTFILNYSKAAEIQASIQDILTERGRIKTSERTNMLVVTDIPANLYKIGEIIKRLDQITTQAFIDTKIITTDAGAVENMGIQWQPTVKLTGSKRPTTFPFTDTSKSISPVINQFFPVQSGGVNGKAPETDAIVNPVDARNFPYPQKINSDFIDSNIFTFGTLDFSSFQATLNFLKASSNTKTVSNPRIVVLNNQTAHIQVGDQVPLPTYERNETTGSMVISGFSYRDTGVVLNVTPHINSSEEILVDVKPEITSRGENQNFGGDVQAPIFNTIQARTQLLIKSGQTIAIGGLLTDNKSMQESKVPYLADVPILGKLFRAKRQGTDGAIGPENKKIETLFFVTVTTVDTQGQPVRSKVDGKKNQSQDDQTRQKTAATDAAPGLKGSEKKVVSDSSNKDKPV